MIRRLAAAVLAVGLALAPALSRTALAAPDADSDAYTVLEDQHLSVAAPGVYANDAIPAGHILCPGSVDDTNLNGSFDFDSDGGFDYQPPADFNGDGESNFFTYTISEVASGEQCPGPVGDGARVAVSVTAVNDAPSIELIGECADGNVSLQEDAAPIAIPCVSFDPGPDDEASQTVAEWTVLAESTIGVPSEPTVTGTGATGTLHVSVNANAFGAINLLITARDSGGTANGGADTSNSVEVHVNVASVPDAPVAVADTFSGLKDQTLNIAAPGVLHNDTDADGDNLTAVLVTTTVHGTLTLAANGAFSYTPAAGYLGPDAFSYRASDGTLQSATRVATLNVSSVPPSPTPAATAAPSAEPTAEPSVEASALPEASSSSPASAAPSASAASSGLPAASASLLPGATAEPAPVDVERGVSMPVLLVLVLLGVLLAFGAAWYVPRWIRAQRTGGEIDDG